MDDVHRDELVQEVRELTDLLRNDPEFGSLRTALAMMGVAPQSALLVWFCEDEELNEFGVVIDPGLQVFRFERDVSGDQIQFKAWERLEFERHAEFPQIAVALEMIATGEI